MIYYTEYKKNYNNEKAKRWRDKHPERFKRAAEKWRGKNKEYYQESRKKYLKNRYKENPEKIKKSNNKYCQTEKGIKSIKRRTKKYRISKKGKIASAKHHSKRKKFGFNILYENIFENEDVHWHHINNKDVVAIPSDIHLLYGTFPVENHRENLKPIIEQLYGWTS